MNEPSESGQLDVGDRQLIHWQMYGDRAGKPLDWCTWEDAHVLGVRRWGARSAV